jgi:2-phosphoglycerate kinase
MENLDNQPKWKVLLIGGSSGAGKTIVAKHVAQHFGLPWLQVDDFRLVLQRATTPAQHPALHFFVVTQNVWRTPPEVLCQHLIEVGRVVSQAIEVAIANHVATNAPVVLEGDGILPSMAAQHIFADLDVGHWVRSVFLYEPEEEALFKSMSERERGFSYLSIKEQQTQARMSWLYGQWLCQEAQRYRLPTLPSRPRATLVERILAVIE